MISETYSNSSCSQNTKGSKLKFYCSTSSLFNTVLHDSNPITPLPKSIMSFCLRYTLQSYRWCQRQASFRFQPWSTTLHTLHAKGNRTDRTRFAQILWKNTVSNPLRRCYELESPSKAQYSWGRNLERYKCRGIFQHLPQTLRRVMQPTPCPSNYQLHCSNLGQVISSGRQLWRGVRKVPATMPEPEKHSAPEWIRPVHRNLQRPRYQVEFDMVAEQHGCL